MGTIYEDIQTASSWVAKALSSSGYQADFSPASLWEIDRFFDEHSRHGKAVRGGLLSQQLGYRIFALGSYVGEVLRQTKGGEWQGDESDPQIEINVALLLPDETTCWPVQRVMKRFKHGVEDSIAIYGSALGLDVGPKPKDSPKKAWWKFW